jgi:hypothetical protein
MTSGQKAWSGDMEYELDTPGQVSQTTDSNAPSLAQIDVVGNLVKTNQTGWTCRAATARSRQNFCARYNHIDLKRKSLVMPTATVSQQIAQHQFARHGTRVDTKTATGWITCGEAIVVRDLNGNGLIDSGRELFGDSTVLTRGAGAGQLAANGFEALADGTLDSADADYSQLRIWQDANQNDIEPTGDSTGSASGPGNAGGNIVSSFISPFAKLTANEHYESDGE